MAKTGVQHQKINAEYRKEHFRVSLKLSLFIVASTSATPRGGGKDIVDFK